MPNTSPTGPPAYGPPVTTMATSQEEESQGPLRVRETKELRVLVLGHQPPVLDPSHRQQDPDPTHPPATHPERLTVLRRPLLETFTVRAPNWATVGMTPSVRGVWKEGLHNPTTPGQSHRNPPDRHQCLPGPISNLLSPNQRCCSTDTAGRRTRNRAVGTTGECTVSPQGLCGTG